MELQVQELLERIKSEGTDAARSEAEKIIAQAEDKARSIIEQSEKTTREMEEASKARIEAMEKASMLALSQASRDTILALRRKVQAFFENMLVAASAETFDAAFLAKVLPSLLKEIATVSSGDLAVLLPAKTLSEIDQALAARLSKELGRGVEFKPFAGLDSGFRVGVSGSSVQYDFSAESVAEVLASRVNARLAECVRESVKGSGRP